LKDKRFSEDTLSDFKYDYFKMGEKWGRNRMFIFISVFWWLRLPYFTLLLNN
jgi:hypothetical protein